MFKVGDKVKCIRPQQPRKLFLDHVYTVLKSYTEGIDNFVKVAEADDVGFFQHRFVKVNTFKGNK